MENIPLFEAIDTLRAVRRFSSAAVPEDAIHKVIEAASHATSGGNRQPWHVVVVRDPELKRRLGEFYWKATQENRARGLHRETPTFLRTGWDMAQHIGESPVILIVCAEGEESFFIGSSIYPFAQMLMLAARGLGLGTCFTTNHRRFEKEVKELLGIPAGWITACLIPLGYPGEGEKFGGARRKPVEAIASYDRWGQHPHSKAKAS
ncbi:MAG: nitroreductase family protein [Chloroflexi bacterium]|nr:nitroreductase family protein [Chloroflexota bacterium]